MNREIIQIRHLGRWLIYFVLMLLLTGYQILPAFAVTAEKEITAGVPANFPPQYSLDKKTGLPQGFAIDIMDEVAQRAGIKVKYVVYPDWQSTFTAIDKGSVILIPNFGITSERSEFVDFTSPVEAFHIVIFVRKSNININSIDDLSGKDVAVVNYNKGRFLMEERGGSMLQIYASEEEAILSLISGRSDALIYAEPPIRYLSRSIGLEDKIKVVGEPLLEVKRGIAVRSGNSELLKMLDAAVTTFVKTPEYAKIYAKWYGNPEQYWTAKRVAVGGGLLLAFVIMALVFWRYRSLVELNKELQTALIERKETQEELARTYRTLSALINNIPDLSWVKDTEGHFVITNQAFSHASGVPKDKLIGKTDFDIWPRELAEKYVADDRHVMAMGQQQQVEETYVDAEGQSHFIETIKTPFRNDAGTIIGTVGIARDITKRKKTEQLLIESQQLLEQSQTFARIGCYVLNIPDGTWSSSTMLDEIFGIGPDYARTTDGWLNIVHPEQRQELQEYYTNHVLRNKHSFNKEYRVMRVSDNAILWVHGFGIVEYSDDGQPFRMFGFIQDISESKKAEEALRISEERLSLALQAAGQGIYDLDIRTGDAVVTQEYALMLGHDPGEFHETNAKWIERLHPDDRKSVAAVYQAYVKGELQEYKVEFRQKAKDGNWKWILSLGKIMERDADGNPQRMIGTHTDITYRKQAEEELREKTMMLENLTANLEQRVQEEVALRIKNEDLLVQQSKMAAMGEMLGAIAHQWRQPLNTLGLIIQDLKDASSYGDLDRQYLETTVKKSMAQIQHMSKTIDDFRNFFRPDKERADFDTMQAVGHVLSLFSAQLISNDIDFRVNCLNHGKTFTTVEDILPSQDKIIKGFQNEFEHVILNMINNAREAIIERRKSGRMPGDGRGIITFDFRTADGRITIAVSNNGSTIPESIINRIFEPYFTTKDPAKGTGLGLYMSKVIIEEHMHGRLTAKNSDQGAVFTIELPLV